MNAEELRVPVTWDTSGVTKGEEEIKQAMARLDAEDEKFAGRAGTRSKAHHSSSARYAGDALNAATGTSGNVNRLRMLEHLGISAAAAVPAVAGIGIIISRVEALRKSLEETAAESERLQSSFGKVMKEGMTDSSAMSAESLGGRAKQYLEAQDAEANHGYEARWKQKYVENISAVLGMPKVGPAALNSVMRAYTGQGLDDHIASSDSRVATGLAGQKLARVQRTDSIKEDLDISNDKTVGSQYDARDKEIERARRLADNQAKKDGLTQEDKDRQNAVFDNEKAANDLRRQQYKIAMENETALARLRGATEERSLASAQEQLKVAEKMVQVAKTDEDRGKAYVAKAKAEQNIDLVEKEQAVRKISRAAALEAGANQLGGAQFALAQATDSMNPNTKFGAEQEIKRDEAKRAVAAAQIHLNEAIEKQKRDPGAAADQEVALAGQAFAGAQVGQAQAEKELKAAARDRFHEMYLTPEGYSNRAHANEVERIRRQTEGRMKRADARLAANGGLINVHRDMAGKVIDGIDPLHPELGRRAPRAPKDDARQQPAAHNPKQELEDLKEAFRSVIDPMHQVLLARLPSITQK